MTVRELREKYLAFFKSKGHVQHPSGSLIPYDVTGRLDESLLFNGAGMVQFKPYFRGVAEPPSGRLTTAQKCIRTGDIEEVGDDSHLTFFEMLGNFSFGDYFKEEAIAMSWEFLTSPEWLGLDPKRLSFTVFLEDDEAFDIWSRHLKSARVDPQKRIFLLDEKTNYWPAGAFSSGPPGPCGPNTEMFYWVEGEPPTGDYTREDWLRDDAEGRWLEVWNDVFIQYEWQGEQQEDGWSKTGMPELPFRSVDTGMGLERTAAVLAGHRSVYDTDAFVPIFEAIAALGPARRDARAERIVADHLRSACFCIADGIFPSNTGRGYVLRRLIRRAVLKGARTLGFDQVFMPKLVSSVTENLGQHYHELEDRREVIVATLTGEEEQFRRTLERGSAMLMEALAAKPSHVDGAFAFSLYDTYGFPIEITRELAAEAGIEVDMAGFKKAMSEAQSRSRAAGGMDAVYDGVEGAQLFGGKAVPPTEFIGYHESQATVQVLACQPQVDAKGRPTGRWVTALDRSPFYAESGGQVADAGAIGDLKVLDVQKQDGVWLHIVEGHEPVIGAAEAKVNALRRAAVTRNHTATHLLHAGLRQVLGAHVSQAGSLVSDEILRFDFTHGHAMTADELAQVERIVNEQVWAAQPMQTYEDVPLDEARAMGAMALFGEKYAERVRVVQVGGMSPAEPSFSRELCGGIHVSSTGEIGLFKIISEASAASGIRRILALTGAHAYEWALDQERRIREAADRLKANPKDLVEAIDRLQEQLKDERAKREKMAAMGAGKSQDEQIGAVLLRIEETEGADPKDCQRVADRLVEGKPNAVALVVNLDGEKLLFVCKTGDAATAAGAHAGNMVKAAALASGGGGGGRPNFATAGGRDLSKKTEAIAAARTALTGQLN
jgi:alanyl-tRNA synthetase